MVDRTDCYIREPNPFSSQLYSQEIRESGLRYKVAVSIETENIVLMCAPFPCGSWPNLKIFKNKQVTKLFTHERIITDKGYTHEKRASIDNLIVAQK